MRQDNTCYAELIEPEEKIDIILKQLNEVESLIENLQEDLWIKERTE